MATQPSFVASTSIVTPTHDMITRSKTNSLKPKQLHTVVQTTSSLPRTFKQAQQVPHWREAIKYEFDTLVQIRTWELVPCDPSKNVVDNTKIVWLLKDSHKDLDLIQGTLGYLDPEYLHTGQLTDRSDVYSFGVVLAELLTGMKPILRGTSDEDKCLVEYFVTSMKNNSLFQILDDRVVREGGVEQLQEIGELIKSCLHLHGEDRPTMKEVAMELESLRKFTSPWTNAHGHEDQNEV
ncbi:hypothetical protein KY285_035454 [Solanum tuberosum]|nr:hypothetical protein KY285_035454 [Solanum tuberosum]